MESAHFNVEFDESEDFQVEMGETVRVSEKDFNKLDNRPKYAGVEMTGDTNIPAVPSSVSQLTNDANYQTGTQVENSISTAVNAEAEARETADTRIENSVSGLTDALAAETTARTQADTSLGNRITNIEGKIPNQASSTNQLADKNFVNSSIATNTANYISDNGQPFSSLADLEAYSGPLTNNDYAFVVGTDSAGNTTYTRYKYIASTDSWAEEYVLNNSSFTAVQWEAINSGITSGNVEKIAGLANIKTIGDNLNLDSNGKLSATDTKYTAGNGLNLNGNEFSVDTNVVQGKLTAGDGITINGNTISANIDPADFFTAEETVSGEGTSVTLNNTMAVPLDNVQLKGDTYQQTYSGKNLFSTEFARSSSPFVPYGDNGFILTKGATPDTRTINFDFPTSLPAGTYEISGLLVSNDTGYGVAFGFYDSSSNKVAGDVSRTNTGNFSFTITTTGALHHIYVYVNNGSTDGTSATLDKMQFELGSSSTSFEPYVGGIPSPNPDYPQEVQTVTGRQVVGVSGKNLCDYVSMQTNYVAGYFEASSTAINGGYTDRNRIGYIPCAKNSTYTLSRVSNNSLVANAMVAFTSATPAVGTTISGARTISPGSTTVTSPNDAEYMIIRLQTPVGVSIADVWSTVMQDIKLQIELGSTSTTYEPYQSQSYEVNLGKNLFDKNSANTVKGYFNPQFPQIVSLNYDATIYIPCQPNTTYTVQRNAGNFGRFFPVGYCTVTPEVGATVYGITFATAENPGKATITTGDNAKYLVARVYHNTQDTLTFGEVLASLQIEKGSAATSYASYFTPIELCKIGDYQDYIYKSGDDWYVHKEVRHLSLPIANMDNGESYPGWEDQQQLVEDIGLDKSGALPSFTTFYTNITAPSETGVRINTLSSQSRRALYLQTSVFGKTQSQWKTDYPDLIFEIYYGIVNLPPDTQITNENLIAQLEALKNASAYDGQTNFTVTAADLAAILNVTAYRKSLAGMIKLLGQ